MHRWFLRFVSETLASLGTRAEQQTEPRPLWQFHSGEDQCVVYDHLVREGQVLLHGGLGFDGWIHAEDLNEAKTKGKGYVEVLLAIAAYASQTSCLPAKAVFAYDASEPETGPRRFESLYHEIKPCMGNLRQLKLQLFQEVFSHLEGADSRIHRAVMWLRKSLSEDTVVDQFAAYWVGLDALSKLLVEELLGERSARYPRCPSCDKEIATCPYCGRGTEAPLPTFTEGIKELFRTQCDIDEEAFKDKWWPNRNKVLHGGIELSHEFVNELSSQLDTLRRALIRGVAVLCNVSGNVVDEISAMEPRGGLGPFVFWHAGTLSIDRVPDLSEVGAQPWLDLSGTAVSYSVSTDGRVTAATKREAKACNAAFSMSEHGLLGGVRSGLCASDFSLDTTATT